MRTAMLLATAVTVAAASAARAGTLGTIRINPDAGVSGTADAAGSDTWRVFLRKGRHYALWGANDGR